MRGGLSYRRTWDGWTHYLRRRRHPAVRLAELLRCCIWYLGELPPGRQGFSIGMIGVSLRLVVRASPCSGRFAVLMSPKADERPAHRLASPIRPPPSARGPCRTPDQRTARTFSRRPLCGECRGGPLRSRGRRTGWERCRGSCGWHRRRRSEGSQRAGDGFAGERAIVVGDRNALELVLGELGVQGHAGRGSKPRQSMRDRMSVS